MERSDMAGRSGIRAAHSLKLLKLFAAECDSSAQTFTATSRPVSSFPW
jgi:hypothetical protein